MQLVQPPRPVPAQAVPLAAPLAAHPAAQPAVSRDRFMRLPEVEDTIGGKKSTIYKMIGEGRFPKPVRLSSRMVVWSEAAVLQWMQERIAQAQGGEV